MNVGTETRAQHAHRDPLDFFFNLFLQGTTGNIELRSMVWIPGEEKYDDDPTTIKRIFSRDLSVLKNFIRNTQDHLRDVFHGVNLRRPGANTAKKKDIIEIVSIFVDVDFKTISKDNVDRALELLALKPSLIIDSGNGYHLYWFLEIPITIQGEKEITLVEGISKGLAQQLGGDHTHDITRILRTPGHINSKYLHKPICKIIYSAGPKYVLDNLKRYWVPVESGNGKIDLGDIGDLPERFKTLLAKNRRVKDTWEGKRPDLKDQSGSGFDMAMADLLAKYNYGPDEIAAVLTRMPSGKGQDATQSYLEHTIGKALNGRSGGDGGNGQDNALNTLNAHSPSPKTAMEPLEAEAMYGLAGDFVKAISPYTEADPVAVLITLLVSFGNVIGRSAHFTVEKTRHYLNIFAILVGLSSKGRKGLSASTMGYIFERIDEDWSKGRKRSGLSSGEGLINEVRDERYEERAIRKHGKTDGYEHVRVDEGVKDKRLLVFEQEFAQGLKTMAREGNILSTTIRQAWDENTLSPMTKHSPIRATGAHVSIIGHITREELLRHLTETEQCNGYANRFLWFLVKRSKELAGGSGTPDEVLDPLIQRLRGAVEFAKSVGLMVRDDKAEALWHAIYHDLSEEKPGLVGAVTARGEPQTMRVACIYALLDCSAVIKEEHLNAALALWNYSENCAKAIFGDLSGDPVADRIMEALQRIPGGMSETDIYNLFSRHVTSPTIMIALDSLLRKGLVKRETVETGGRPKTIWCVAQKAQKAQ